MFVSYDGSEPYPTNPNAVGASPGCDATSPPGTSNWICTRTRGHDVPNSSDNLLHMAGIGGDSYVCEWDNDRTTD